MDYGMLSVEEIRRGYRFDAETNAYVCLVCGGRFAEGQVYPLEGSFYLAEPAAARHVVCEHGGSAARLIDADTKYNTLTEIQKELLRMIAAGIPDREIAKSLGITEATVRRQRFNFREKAKQAKYYLAMYGQVFEAMDNEELIPVHNQASMMDDRYVITEQEREKMLKGLFTNRNPLRLKVFPAKEKKKVVVLAEIAGQFELGKHYTEREVNDILQPIYADYATIRRYLVSCGLMDRTPSGSEYWLTE